jgi:hypothetical protein
MTKQRSYEAPKITTLTSEEILDLMGPAQASASGVEAPTPYGGVGTTARGGSSSRFDN